MTDKQAQQIYDYVCEVADKFALKDWDFDIETEPPVDSGSLASVNPIYGRKYFRLRVREDFAYCNPSLQRQTIVHELVHCHMAPAQRWVESLAESADLTRTAIQAFHMNLEYGVDGLADAVAPLMPLPQWKKKSRSKIK